VAVSLFLLVKNDSIVSSFTISFHVHRQADWCFEMFLWKRCVRRLFKTLRHLQSFVAVFNEQVEIIKKSNAGLWDWSPTNSGWLDLEPKLFRGWTWSLKFRFQFHRYSLWSKRVSQIFYRSRSQKHLDAAAGDKKLNTWSWTRSLKFEFWLHSPGQKHQLLWFYRVPPLLSKW